MKKTTLIAIALAATLILGGGGVFAAGQIARSNAISEENARNFAYADAGILPEKAEFVSTRFEFSKGRFVYEIEFVAEGVQYEYTLDSSTGAVIEKEKEILPRQGGQPGETPTAETRPTAAETTPAAPQIISLAEAKQIVLKELKLEADTVSFMEGKLEKEDGLLVYEIDIKTGDGSEHEYELDARDGRILKESHKMAQAKATQPAPTTPAAQQPTTRATAPTTPASTQAAPTQPATTAPAPVQPTVPATTPAAQQPTTRATAPTTPAPTQAAPTQPATTAPAPVQPTTPAPTTPAPTQPTTTRPVQPTTVAPTQPTKTDIGLDRAKAIALKDAGLTAAQVTITKAKQDFEDGRLVYEVEFYVLGQLEYEYTIDAYSGIIVEKDVEDWDD